MGNIIGRFFLPHPPIIVPQVGGGNRHVAYKTVDAMNTISKEISQLQPDTIIVVSPHGTSFSDAFSVTDSFFIEGDFSEFGSTLSMEKDIDKAFVKDLKNRCFKERIPLVPLDRSTEELYDMKYALDHGAMVPLFFIDKFYSKYKIVSITFGGTSKMSHYNLGRVIESIVSKSDKNYVVIGSGDLSHRLIEDSPYGYHPSGKLFDDSILQMMKDNSLESVFNMEPKLIKESFQCGLKSLYVLLGTLDRFSFESEVLSYEHPFGVGYCVCRIISGDICETKLDKLNQSFERSFTQMKSNESSHVALARDAIENYTKFKNYIDPPANLPPSLVEEKKGAFVSIKMDGELRGCIGTLLPTCDRLCDEIIKNAIESCSHDPRFSPITEDELPFLNISVDVLEEAETTTFGELDPFQYGIIVSTENKKGVLLPDLEGVDTPELQVDIALKKAGIAEEENYKLERFKVTRYK